MEGPETTPTTTLPPQEPSTVITPRIHWGRWFFAVIIIVGLLIGLYWYTQKQSSSRSTETPTNVSADTVSEQLKSISTDNSTTTIQQEIDSTNLEDITPELDNISAESQGL